jgi:hypothetical protein
MKAYLSNYRNHWLSPYVILKTICFWEKDEDRIYNLKEEADNPYVKWVNFLNPICEVWQKILDFIHPRFNYVKIDRWDTWSMDHTLAYIIHPMLVQLNKSKQGAPFTDDEDVPEYLRSHMAQPKEYEWDTDSLHFMRWEWILKEMIWAFEQELKDDDESQFFDHSECGDEKFPWNKDGQYVSKLKMDEEGLKEHQDRKRNGFRLFGKYYQALWE